MSWLLMWCMIFFGKRGLSFREVLAQPSVLIIFSVSMFTILPGFVLANTQARLFRFEETVDHYLELGNLYAFGFLLVGLLHLIVSWPSSERQERKEALARPGQYHWVALALLISVLITAYYVSLVGFIVLQTRDVSSREALPNEGFFAFWRMVPFSCLAVLSFASVKQLKPPFWLISVNCLICFACGIIMVDRLLFVFTVSIFIYFLITQTRERILLKFGGGIIAFVILFSLISFYRFTHDHDYNLGGKHQFQSNDIAQQIGINLVFFDNITAVAAVQSELSQSGGYYGGDSYLYSILQFVPQVLWSDKAHYINYERVVQRLGNSIGMSGVSITPGPWGEFIVCFGDTFFIVFALIFAVFLRYLDNMARLCTAQPYAKQFFFGCFILNLMINARSTVSGIIFGTMLFCVPAIVIFCITYKTKIVVS